MENFDIYDPLLITLVVYLVLSIVAIVVVVVWDNLSSATIARKHNYTPIPPYLKVAGENYQESVNAKKKTKPANSKKTKVLPREKKEKESMFKSLFVKKPNESKNKSIPVVIKKKEKEATQKESIPS